MEILVFKLKPAAHQQATQVNTSQRHKIQKNFKTWTLATERIFFCFVVLFIMAQI